MLENQIFNHKFIYSDSTGSFPAGWQKYRGSTRADFYWEKEDDSERSIKITNKLSRMVSICQQRLYRIPVAGKQVWEIGAVLKVNKKHQATIIIHFISKTNSRTLHTRLDFMLETGSDYYCDMVTIPLGVDYALVEIGLPEAGTLWIEDVTFKRVYPVEKYNTDAQGRLNINNVASVKKISDTVNVSGMLEVKKDCRDVLENVVAGPEERLSRIHDVLNLSIYSYCVVNQGDAEGVVKMQLSPDKVNWIDEINYDFIEAGQMKVFVSNYFLRYIRLKYWTEKDTTTKLNIYFQGHG